jgi:mannose-6-phosphate isomerase-like protein (cupin superfamily)
VDFELFPSSREENESNNNNVEWRLEQEHYEVYYVLSGEGKLGHFSGSHADEEADGDDEESDRLIRLHSGDIFVLAPRTPYHIETNKTTEGEEPLALLSISVPVTLLAYSSNKHRNGNHDTSSTSISSLAGLDGTSVNDYSNNEDDDSDVYGGGSSGNRPRVEMPVQILEKHMETESCLLSSRLRRTTELLTFQLPNNTKNRIAPVFDPFRDCTPFTCSIEILEPEGVIPRHMHEEAYELFIVLSGACDLYLGTGNAPTARRQGDCCLVKPGNIHSLVNPDREEKLYMLSIILPNETFAEDVWNGTYSGPLQHADVTHLIRQE